MPQLSVIMATKNPDYDRLEQAVQSILNQSMTDFEFIIIDDGSALKYQQIFQELTKLDKRVRVFRNSHNIGLAASLNRAFSISTGNLIARMDDDDESLQGRFSQQVQFLREHPRVAFVGCNVIKFGVSSNDGLIKLPRAPQAKNFLWNSPYIHPTVMFRREALAAVDGYREIKATRRAEDYDLFMRMHIHGLYGANIQTPLFKYFIDVSSMKRKRKYRYRIDEFVIRKQNFKALKLPFYRILFIVKPLIVGLIPQNILYGAHKIIKR